LVSAIAGDGCVVNTAVRMTRRVTWTPESPDRPRTPEQPARWAV